MSLLYAGYFYYYFVRCTLFCYPAQKNITKENCKGGKSFVWYWPLALCFVLCLWRKHRATAVSKNFGSFCRFLSLFFLSLPVQFNAHHAMWRWNSRFFSNQIELWHKRNLELIIVDIVCFYSGFAPLVLQYLRRKSIWYPLQHLLNFHDFEKFINFVNYDIGFQGKLRKTWFFSENWFVGMFTVLSRNF